MHDIDAILHLFLELDVLLKEHLALCWRGLGCPRSVADVSRRPAWPDGDFVPLRERIIALVIFASRGQLLFVELRQPALSCLEA